MTPQPAEAVTRPAADEVTVDMIRPEPPSRPRIWTVFVTLVAALAAVLALQAAVGVAVAVWMVGRGVSVARLEAELIPLLTKPWTVIALGSASQAVFLATAFLAARLSREPTGRRLGLVRPALRPFGYAALAFGSWLPLAVGVGLAYSLPESVPKDPSAKMLYEQMTWTWALPFLLFISVAPGVCEEVFFRGYFQRRLQRRWSPWAAIGVTSLLFALFHMVPHTVVAVFPLGVWLGWIAWRTGSIWPGVVCHAFVNGSWNVRSLGIQLAGWPEEPPAVLSISAGLIALVSFVISVRMLTRPALAMDRRPASP